MKLVEASLGYNECMVEGQTDRQETEYHNMSYQERCEFNKNIRNHFTHESTEY